MKDRASHTINASNVDAADILILPFSVIENSLPGVRAHLLCGESMKSQHTLTGKYLKTISGTQFHYLVQYKEVDGNKYLLLPTFAVKLK